MPHPWFATKSVDELRAEADHGGFHRRLGAFDLVVLGVGAIIGSGIFVLTGHAAAVNAGPAIPISFAIAGVAAGFAALCYAEMSSMIPVAGSAYTYAYATLGELLAWIIGWDLILEYLIGAATVSVGWSSHVVAFFEHVTGYALPPTWTSAPIRWNAFTHAIESTGAVLNLPAVLIVLAITFVLVLGIRESARLNAGIVFIKLAVLLLFIAVASRFVNPENWRPFIPENTGSFGHYGGSGVFQGATMVFFAYIGFDAVSTAAQETRRPQRDLPIGILVSLAICTVLYVAISVILTGLVPYPKLSVADPMVVGAKATPIGWLETAVEVGAIAGLSSVMLVMLLAQPRIFYAMARDGLFPPFAKRIHPRFGTPHVATWITGAVCALLGGILPIEILGELTSIGTLFAFVLVSLGVMVLRLRRPDLPRGFRVPGGPYLVPLFGAASAGTLIATATKETLLRLFVWMGIGLLLYACYGRRHSRLRARLRARAMRP
jgi:APA family basic amino acid/polyamine antiporter